MKPKKRIGILGIGAVGGYFGGLLAGRYYHSDEAEIIFIARPASEQVIREKGLKLISADGERIVFPDTITSDSGTAGILDFLICAVKSYDLEDSLASLKNSINEHTFILPLLNGVDAYERIRKLYPDSNVLEGCVYLVGRLLEPGVVKDLGNIRKLHFGSAHVDKPELEPYAQLFKNAGIDCYLEHDINLATWEKFIFIAGLANATAYLDHTIGEVLRDHRPLLNEILAEVKLISDAKQIHFPEDIIERTIKKMESLPFEGTSSMHSDLKKGGRTEYQSITGYLVREGDALNIDTPVLDKIFNMLDKTRH